MGIKFSSENYLSDERISPGDTSERSTEVNIQLNAETSEGKDRNKFSGENYLSAEKTFPWYKKEK